MPKLYPEDQARVDEVLSKGIYKPDRPKFRPFLLLLIILGLLGLLSLASWIIAKLHGLV